MKNKKIIALLSLLTVLVTAGSSPLFAAAETVPAIKKSKTNLYTELVDQSVFYEFTSYLRMDRLYRKLFNKKVHAEDINVYDEVPDSAFFQNRHAKEALSAAALEKGYAENEGPAGEGEITITKGKTEGLHPGFFVKDSKGDSYLLKFDPSTNLELNTSAEIISSRFYHAIGYNVPQYTIFTFDSNRLVPAPDATFVDRTGFKKILTKDILEEYLVHLPRDINGNLRASASKLLAGENKGDFKFEGRRKDDPADTIDHEKRRAIRALAVFGALINNNDVRRQNTLDMLVTENGQTFLKHFLIDFNSSLGAAAGGSKPPMFTHEYFVDHSENVKNIFGLGFRKSTWRKRWEEAGQMENESFAQGYLDNRYFSAPNYKVQLPHYVFKDMTRADGYWAAKIIKKFSDENIKAMISAGKYSSAEDAEFVFKIISERREAIARYWFSQASPLENFNFENQKLTFTDLEADYAYAEAGSSSYTLEAIGGTDKKGKKLGSLESAKPEFEISSEWNSFEKLTLLLTVKRSSEEESRPYVLVELKGGKITKVLHRD